VNGIAASLGEVGLPMPVRALASRDWDAIVVGGGHNGLAAAAYLARAGRSVLVLERRERLGGACTLERPFDDDRFVISPCAYVVGLLDEVVIRELGLDPERVNVNGGAIALGHPLGMSGARLVVSLLHELRRRDGRYGLATLCVGVGQGQAALFER